MELSSISLVIFPFEGTMRLFVRASNIGTSGPFFGTTITLVLTVAILSSE